MAGTEKKMTGPKVSEFGIRRPAERNTGQCRLEKCHWQRGNQESGIGGMGKGSACGKKNFPRFGS